MSALQPLRPMLLCVSILLCVSLVSAAAPSEVVVWVNENAIPLSTTEINDDLSDLECLRGLIGDAHIVGLGEQTHGTSEFVTMKHRVIRFLIEEMGFTAVALEASWSGGLLADRYVTGQKGKLDDALLGLSFWVYNCPEFVQLISWMHDYNRHAEEPVHLVGMDNKTPHQALEWLRKTIPYNGAPYNASFIRDIKSRLPMKAPKLASEDPSIQAEYFSFLRGLIDEMLSELPEFQGMLSPLELAIVERIPRAVDQVQDYTLIADTTLNAAGWWVPTIFNYRDACMAENTIWWLEQLGEDAKIIVYAHNGHVARRFPETESITMGQNLSEVYGDEYVSVGFSTCEGTFVALNQEIDRLGSLVLPSPLADSYESVLCNAEIPDFLLDLRALDTGSLVSNWMNMSRPFKLIGSVPDLADGAITSANTYDVCLPMQYDLLIHIKRTHAMELDL